MATLRSICVTGDFIVDEHLARIPGAPFSHSEPLPAAIQRRSLGGVWQEHALLRLACADLADLEVAGPPSDGVLESPASQSVARAVAVWAPFLSTGEGAARVWRIESFLGCYAGASLTPTPSPAALEKGDDASPLQRRWRGGGGETQCPQADLLVLVDSNLGFRHDERRWPAAVAEPKPDTQILLKTISPLGHGRLWDELITHHADRLTVVISASSLQARQAAISQELSWDRTIEDVAAEFSIGSSASDLGRARRVVVYFRGAGVAIFTRSRQATVELERFVFHPDELTGSWHSRRPGGTFGASSILTASIARHLLDPTSYPIFTAASRALAAIRHNHQRGGGEIRGRSVEAMLASFRPEALDEALGAILHPSSDGARLPSGDEFRAAFPRWYFSESNQPIVGTSDLLQDVTGPGYEYVMATAMQVVLHGVERTLDSCPKARYGAYFTVDREEIERINEIRRLITSYRANDADRRPLSIAVFGPPGSGKSFAIKQVAQELFGRLQAVFEFNLTQFNGRDSLILAFDQIRDATVRGQIPLVFWDEFDADQLAWLKEFLAPMQDAEFRAGGAVHPFGKAIFVFAGGTCATFGEFDRSASAGPRAEPFKLVKGPDFISRLRGYVNIKGPNPVARSDAGSSARSPERDVAHLIRRAILLRSVLERSFPHLIDASGSAAISASVIRGFLRAAMFYHSARSLEAIVSMSGIGSARHYGVAELPSSDLLDLHVTPDFMRWVREGELEEATIELLAEATHEAWRRQRLDGGWSYGSVRSDERKSHPLLVDYHLLADIDRERNRHSARVTLAKLHQIGYRIVPAQSLPAEERVERRLADRERQRLVEIEHEIWLRDRLLRGYAYGDWTDERLRIHRDIVPFDQLPADDRRLSEATVDGIPGVLWRGGFVLISAAASDRVRVGVTGHRILAEPERVSQGVGEALRRIRDSFNGRPLTVYSSLAEGADRLVAEEALRQPDTQIVAVLPFGRDDYSADFGHPGTPSRLHFGALLERAAEVIELAPGRTREEGYAQAGNHIVNLCDVLLAIWDGEHARGEGGTAHVVGRARALGKPIVIVRAGNHHPDTREPRSLGQEQGVVLAEGLPARELVRR
jgi:hypothetical protein